MPAGQQDQPVKSLILSSLPNLENRARLGTFGTAKKEALDPRASSVAGNSPSQIGLNQVKPVEVHHLIPGRHKIVKEFPAAIVGGIDLRQRPQL